MPKYTFVCEKCSAKVQKYVSSKVEELLCECGGKQKREFPSIKESSEVRETVDSNTNVSWSQDQAAMIKARKEQHYWEVEVPRMVEKYSIETCLEQKWLVYNDKGELVINKAPSKR